MIFKRGAWYPISIAVIVINVAGGIYASLTSEPVHAFLHGAFAVVFGFWAWHLRQQSEHSEKQVGGQDKVQLLEANLSQLERELRETQDRLDFADQLLKKRPPSS
jgi:hypothetical protein